MKKIMILGGSENQLPLIRSAKREGYSITLCDYNEDNVGKKFVDTFHGVSILDRHAVLEVAKKENVDGITTNSEPGMLVASYVCNKLGLPSNPYDSVVTLSRKDLFRKFLKNNQFNCPQSYDTNDYQSASDMASVFRYPLMVKPVDSSGSRGVSLVNSITSLRSAFELALGFSKVKRVMIEEYIEKSHEYMVGGDIFVVDGEVVFWGLMNCLRNSSVNAFVPIGKSFPALVTNVQLSIIKETVSRMIKLLNIRFGAFNVELMFGEGDELFIIEMNPRNGGNRIPQILKTITGVDLFEATIKASLGIKSLDLTYNANDRFVSSYILHSDRAGIFRGVSYSDEIRANICEENISKQVGERVERFVNADKLIGIVVLEFSSLSDMRTKLRSIGNLIRVEIDDVGPDCCEE